MIVGNLFQQFYNMADSIVVGQFLGVNALAAVGSTGSINFMILGFATGSCSGLCIPIAQAFGAGDMKTMRRYVTNAVYISAAITVFITAGTMLFTRQILLLMQTPANILEDAYSYIIVVFAGTGALMLYNLLSGILRALGDSKTPLYFLIIAAVLNIILDIVFVVPLKMGTAGAAYATIIAQAVSGLLCLPYIWKRFPILHMKKEDWRPGGTLIRRLLVIGLPMGLQFSLTAVGSIVLQTAVNGLGSAAVAAMTAGGKVSLILTQPMESIGLTMATYCGQNLGAGKNERVKAGFGAGVKLLGSICLCFTALYLLAGRQLLMLFMNSPTGEAVNTGLTFLQTIAPFYLLLAFKLTSDGLMRGCGMMGRFMATTLSDLFLRVVLAILFSSWLGVNGIWLSWPVGWFVGTVLSVVFYRTSIYRQAEEKTTL